MVHASSIYPCGAWGKLEFWKPYVFERGRKVKNVLRRIRRMIALITC